MDRLFFDNNENKETIIFSSSEQKNNQKNKSRKVYIIDQSTVFRIGISAVLTNQNHYELAGEYSCYHQLLKHKKPDDNGLLIGDFKFIGCKEIVNITNNCINLRIIIFLCQSDVAKILTCINDSTKIKGFISRNASIETILSGIETVHNGNVFIDPVLASEFLVYYNTKKNIRLKNSSLTKREKSILQMVSQGMRNKEIGGQLFICERTVKFHISSILRKLNASNRTMAASIASGLGLI